MEDVEEQINRDKNDNNAPLSRNIIDDDNNNDNDNYDDDDGKKDSDSEENEKRD